MSPEFCDFIHELRSCPETVKRADDLEAFFDFWERQFHEVPGGAGAFAIEQTDAMRRIVRQKDRSAKDRLTELIALLRKIATEAKARANRANALAKFAGESGE